MKKFFVYIVRCADDSLYTGYTDDLGKRIHEHNNTKRKAKYLRGRCPVELVWSRGYKIKYYALKLEYKIKQLSRAQKQLLVNGMRLDRVIGRKHGKDK